MIHFLTYYGQQYTISSDGTLDRPARIVGVSRHRWTQQPDDTLSDVQEVPELMRGTYVWTDTGRWADRVKEVWTDE